MPEPESAGRRGWTGSAADLEEVLRLTADPITVQAADGRLVYANEAAARQVGFASAVEFLAAPIDEIMSRYQLIDEDGRPLPIEDLPGRRALRGEREPEAVVGFRVRGDHGPRWSIVQATPVVGGDEVRFVINAFQDVTRLKRSEDRMRILADAGELLASSVDYQAALQSLADLVVPRLADWCVVDVVEHSGLRRVAVAHPDPEMRRLAEELERRYPPDPERAGGVAEVIRTGTTQIVPTITDEMLAIAAHDDEHLGILRSLRLRSAAIVPLVARGEILGGLTFAGSENGHVYFEADRPFLEDLALRAAAAIDTARLLHEANEAIRLRDDFLAMASHDMRTPLQAILANVQLAARRLDRAAGQEVASEMDRARDNLVQAERTTARLGRLVGDLLDVAMLRSGHDLPMELEGLDLAELAGRVAEEHQPSSTRHRIVVGGSGAVVRSDRERLQRVLDNLVENAIKYSPDGGEIVIEVGSDADAATVVVRDHGMGIPADELEAVFEPYHRASNATTMRGIGLGLSGSRAVVHQLGGELTVESTEGSGSAFMMRLPRD